MEGRILEFFYDQFRKRTDSSNKHLLALGHSVSVVSYFHVVEGYGDNLL